jgi:hypothetical protein
VGWPHPPVGHPVGWHPPVGHPTGWHPPVGHPPASMELSRFRSLELSLLSSLDGIGMALTTTRLMQHDTSNSCDR